MASNKGNIFCATNPARMLDALAMHMFDEGASLSDMLIFLPSRRAVRAVEEMIVKHAGGAAILPHLVALGEGGDATDEDDEASGECVSDTYRVIALARLLSGVATIGTISSAIPIARDLIRMVDYLDNEGIDVSTIDWNELVDTRYAAHFQGKAALLNILGANMNDINSNLPTRAHVRNRDIRAWISHIENAPNRYSRIIVCGSTASVPATSDLMAYIAGLDKGRIILSGKIDGRDCDFALDTNPYNAEYKFLSRIGCTPSDVMPIDVGPSAIDFFNFAFGNDASQYCGDLRAEHCHLIECSRESEEAAAIAEIAARAMQENKSVLIITPDAAGGMRISSELSARGICSDSSGGMSGATTLPARAILNMFDEWIEKGGDDFNRAFAAAGYNLFDMIAHIVDTTPELFCPSFDAFNAAYAPVWAAIMQTSDCMRALNIIPNVTDARALIADGVSGVTIRPNVVADARVCVLGTIESRMQTADVVILSGLNEGMFPDIGYENPWIPRHVAAQIGLPSPDRKVSLMSLDFMNLSCGPDVYWTRSKSSGGTATLESRFLSRITARRGEFDTHAADDILRAVRMRDNVASRPIDMSAPTPPADWSDVYVTELDLLVHNPYAFYVHHILRLRRRDDYWAPLDARAFGNLVHAVIEDARDISAAALLADMRRRAAQLMSVDTIMYRFWDKRFMEIAPVISAALADMPSGIAETPGAVSIGGRIVRARADRVWAGGVMDIKTGAAPTKSQLDSGTMPQLPLEAYMLQSGGFRAVGAHPQTPAIMFLQLKSGDARPIVYDGDAAQSMINAAVAKTKELFDRHSAGGAPYEYYDTSDAKYHQYDDFARVE